MQNILSQWLSWQFFEVPREILRAWKNFLRFNLNYFSVPLLLRTFFSPWRRYKVVKGKGFDFGKFFEGLASSLIFRALGALMRSFLIFFGLFLEVLILLGGLVIFSGWFVLPALLVAGFIFGFMLIL